MEKALKKLFDYQRFEQNEKLEKLIRETENRYAGELSDDDLTLVSAAGEINPGRIDENKPQEAATAAPAAISAVKDPVAAAVTFRKIDCI